MNKSDKLWGHLPIIHPTDEGYRQTKEGNDESYEQLPTSGTADLAVSKNELGQFLERLP